MKQNEAQSENDEPEEGVEVGRSYLKSRGDRDPNVKHYPHIRTLNFVNDFVDRARQEEH